MSCPKLLGKFRAREKHCINNNNTTTDSNNNADGDIGGSSHTLVHPQTQKSQGEADRGLRAPAALTQDPDSVSSTHMATVPGDTMPFSGLCGSHVYAWCTDIMQAKHSYT